MTAEMLATVGIWDPLPVFRRGLRSALTQVFFTVAEPADIVAWARAHPARNNTGRREQWAVLLSLTHQSDWNVLDRLIDHGADAPVVTLLQTTSAEAYRDVLRRGALSAAPRSASSDQIVAVVRAAVGGRSLLPGMVSRALANGPGRADVDQRVSNEEQRWLRVLAEGASVEELAWRFGYSRRTMYRRLNQVYRRLGTDRREGAIVAALRAGVI